MHMLSSTGGRLCAMLLLLLLMLFVLLPRCMHGSQSWVLQPCRLTGFTPSIGHRLHATLLLLLVVLLLLRCKGRCRGTMLGLLCLLLRSPCSWLLLLRWVLLPGVLLVQLLSMDGLMALQICTDNLRSEDVIHACLQGLSWETLFANLHL